jgi:hypothetical protein
MSPLFTVPQPIAAIALQNKASVYNILFRAASETLRTIAAKGRTGDVLSDRLLRRHLS